MKEQPKVMYDSAEAAQQVTVTGWRSRNGHFCGDNEHLARWDGCTHLLCDCGAEMDRGYTLCRSCRDKQRLERYEAMPFQEWDRTTPLTLHDDDEYFWDEDSVWDYCELNGIKPEGLRLVICEPNYAWEIEADDYYGDDLPEDQPLNDVYPDLAEAIEKVNEMIRKKERPLSWGGGKYRTTLQITSSSNAA
ncbi:hypothetical protein [Zavarzinella formosa]|uniref:hypothetical protein n=1 Tax=Zavarzinella formosa TaxID=360055 RepID=UPI00036FCAF7|nr:hypothetical protein [Zavarzinella formosa]